MDPNEILFEKLAKLQNLLMNRRSSDASSAAEYYAKNEHQREENIHDNKDQIFDTLRGQGRILALLKIKDGVSTKDMSQVLGIRTSSLNEVLLKLESKNYIVREQSRHDKRVIIVKLTNKGRSVQQSSVKEKAGGVFDCLTRDEKSEFGVYLDRIIFALESRMGKRAGSDLDDIRRQHEEAFRRFFGNIESRVTDGPFPFGPRGHRNKLHRSGGRGPLVDYGNENKR